MYFSSGLPDVSYLQCIDVWMVTCLGYVVYSLVAFCIEISLHSLEKRKRNEVAPDTESVSSESPSGSGKDVDGFDFQAKRIFNYIKVANAIEKVSFYLYPISFTVFAVLYWVISLYLAGRSPFKSLYVPTNSSIVSFNF